MYTQRRSARSAWCVVCVFLICAFATSAWADDDPPGRVARLSYMRGSVSFQPSGDDQWAEASLNRPLGTGDKLYTDKDSRAELEIGAADIRLDQGSTFNLLNLDDNTAQIELTEGTVNLRVRRILDGQNYEIDTPTLAFVIRQPGEYRIDIAPQGDSTMVSVVDGAGDVYGEDNASYSVRSGNSYKFNDSALRDYEVQDLPRRDDFDEWCATRSQRYERATSRQYVAEDTIGTADLDEYGGWNDEPEYGHVWYPTTVEADWAPYRAGHWSWVDPWGWSWVDSSPWGFAPFHYGRWVSIRNRWGWCPGEYRARPIYAPALVAFVGGGGWGTGVSVGIGGPVGWFPLGPRDVYVPWYRGSRNYFTNINRHNTTIINNTYITNVYNNYSNGRPINGNYAYRNNVGAVTAVSRDTFVGSRGVLNSRVQVNEANLRNAQVVSRVGIAPERASFAVNARGAAPAAAALDRRVIARTAPPAQAAPIASRIQAIQRNGSQPLAATQMRQIAGRTAPSTASAPGGTRALNNSRVQVVSRSAAATKPQPIPMRGAAANPTAATRGATPAAPANPSAPNGRAPITAPTTGRAPITAPGASSNPTRGAVQAPNGQAIQNGAQGRGSLPSSRFAPHPGQSTGNVPPTGNRPTGNSATTRAPLNGANVNPATRNNATPADRAIRSPGASQTAPGNGANNGQIRPAAPIRELPRTNTPANPATQRSVAPSQPATRNVPQRSVTPQYQQPRASTPQPQYQRSVQQPQRTVQPQYQQPQRSVQPQVQQQRSVQPQVQQQRSVQPQVQRAPQVQQQRAPAPQPRAQPERKETNDRKDRDHR